MTRPRLLGFARSSVRFPPAIAWLCAGLPSYLTELPLDCTSTPAATLFATTELELALCRPKARENPDLTHWVQTIAEAMLDHGGEPRLQLAPLGPHLSAVTGASVVSATFVRGEHDTFDVWLSVQRPASATDALPVLPQGALLLADQRDTERRLIAIELKAPWRQAKALASATLAALGAELLGEHALKDQGFGGRLQWQGRTGIYQSTPIDDRRTQLTLFVADGR